jgi:hypothetical protein
MRRLMLITGECLPPAAMEQIREQQAIGVQAELA